MKYHQIKYLQVADSSSLLGDGSARLVTGSADRSMKLWDISRPQADTVSVLKATSSVCSGIVSSYLFFD